MLNLSSVFFPRYAAERERTRQLFAKEIANESHLNQMVNRIAKTSKSKFPTAGWRRQIPLFSSLNRLIVHADCKLSTMTIFALCIAFAVLGVFTASKFVGVYFLPLIMFGCFLIPIGFLQNQANKRAMIFLSDYPSILLAVASYMKAGLSLYPALEKSVRLLPKNNLVATEIELLLEKIAGGVNKETAINQFAETIRLPELELFRRALYLITENGGKFAPTLQRLALISKDRANLILSAKTNTTSMKLTANILLGLTPLLVLFTAARTKNFWDLILHQPTANTLASIGLILILFNYILLRSMSNFKP
jgi:Flp pilus assembly protein TadB